MISLPRGESTDQLRHAETFAKSPGVLAVGLLRVLVTRTHGYRS
jgi:hypothetical protein